MKTYLLCAALFFICLGKVVFGHDAETVYIDGGLVSYCQSSNVNNAVVALYLHDIAFSKASQHYFLGFTRPTCISKDRSCMFRFPLAWSVRGKTLYIIAPDVVTSAIGRIMFQLLMLDDIAEPDRGPQDRVHETFTTMHDGVMVYHSASRRQPQFRAWWAEPSSSRKLRDPRNEVVWYGVSDTNFIARLPLAYEGADTWRPCDEPVRFRWMECISVGWDSFERDVEVLHSEDFPPDGFAPVGSVRIVGKRVLSDDPKAAFPQDAEWLIWESDGTAGRLCQMRGGRWSVCTDAPRTDAPKVIVVNNDSSTVMLCYSIAIDAQDIAGSMQRITDLLKERGVLEAGGGRPE